MKLEDKLIYEHSKSLIVLYVEDDEKSRQEVLSVLNSYFKQVDEAFDAEDGLEKYKSYKKNTGNTYDIVISNIELPQLDGIELGWQIMDINPWQAIVFTSSFNKAEKLKKAIQMGAKGFLDKPVVQEQLKGLIFKVSKSVSDSKLVDEYYKNIEIQNLQLENEHKKLENKDQVSIDTSSITSENYGVFKTEIDSFIENDLDELMETQEEINMYILKCRNEFNFENISILSEKIKHYVKIMSGYSFFLLEK